jgi:hypothetical protein
MKNWPHCPTPKKIRLEVPGIVGLTLDWWLPKKMEKWGHPLKGTCQEKKVFLA